MYSRSLEIYSRGPYSLYLQGTWNKECEMWSHNHSSIKDTIRITDSRPCTNCMDFGSANSDLRLLSFAPTCYAIGGNSSFINGSEGEYLMLEDYASKLARHRLLPTVPMQGRRSRCGRCGGRRTNVWPKIGRQGA